MYEQSGRKHELFGWSFKTKYCMPLLICVFCCWKFYYKYFWKFAYSFYKYKIQAAESFQKFKHMFFLQTQQHGGKRGQFYIKFSFFQKLVQVIIYGIIYLQWNKNYGNIKNISIKKKSLILKILIIIFRRKLDQTITQTPPPDYNSSGLGKCCYGHQEQSPYLILDS